MNAALTAPARRAAVPLQDAAGLCRRLLRGNARPKPPEGGERLGGGILRGRRFDDVRQPEFGFRSREAEPLGQHADDHVRIAAEVDGGSDDGRIRCETVRPGAVAQQHDALRAGPRFLLQEEPPHVRRHSEQREQRRRDPGAAQGGAAPLGGGSPVGGELLERLGVLLQQGHRAVRQEHVRKVFQGDGLLADAHDGAGIRVRQRPQQDAVDDAEHGGVRPDAQREDEHHGGREAGTSPQAADRVAQVAPQIVEPAPAPCAADPFPTHDRTPEPRRPRRIVRREAALTPPPAFDRKLWRRLPCEPPSARRRPRYGTPRYHDDGHFIRLPSFDSPAGLSRPNAGLRSRTPSSSRGASTRSARPPRRSRPPPHRAGW